MGWLDTSHDFPRGEVAMRLVEKMKMMAAKPTELYRGFHLCEFCQVPEEVRNAAVASSSNLGASPLWMNWAKPRMSYGEIRVKRGKVTYAAPMLIAHYVEAHSYLPPEEFLDALELEVEPSPASLTPPPAVS